MNLKGVGLVLLGLALVGCATAWVAPAGHSAQEIARDDYECRRESRVVAYPPSAEPGTRDAFTRGYHRGLLYGTLREARELYDLCLEARGYTPEGDSVDWGSHRR